MNPQFKLLKQLVNIYKSCSKIRPTAGKPSLFKFHAIKNNIVDATTCEITTTLCIIWNPKDMHVNEFFNDVQNLLT
jgi:hypothetical protein